MDNGEPFLFMSTPEGTITAGVQSSGDTLPAGGGSLVPASPATPAAPASDQGLTTSTTPAPVSTGDTAAPALDSILASIPDNDDDLSQPNFKHVEGLRAQRQQLRTLSTAIKGLQPAQQQLSEYQKLGELKGLQNAAKVMQLLYTPVLDNFGEPIVDPDTQTAYVTTKPALEFLDEFSPGMPEQLFTDLLDFQPTDEAGNKMPKLSVQWFAHMKLRPELIPQYRALSTAQPSPRGKVTADELADIAPEYHEAYRNLPPSVRNAWDAYEDSDQLLILQNQKELLDSRQFRTDTQAESERAKLARQQQYQQLVQQEQAKYFATVRHERFTSIAADLASKITFSTDPATNTVMHGAVLAVAANLIDPDLRFVTEQLVTALGIKLDHTFDEALNAFNVHAGNAVANAMAGDELRANEAEEKANAAANLLTVKLGVIALAVAKAMGGQQAAAATAQAGALSAAATSRPNAGLTTPPPGTPPGILPPGMRPGSPEAARWLAQETGFLRPVA